MGNAMNTLEKFEQNQINKLVENKNIPDFQAGDSIRVNVKIVEGNKERIQGFEGICIARKNRGINSSFTVRKISNGEGVERIFPLYSTRIEEIKVIRKGDVRRAKLYYMRELSGKAARIKEKRDLTTPDKAAEPVKKKETKVEAAPKPKKKAETKAKKER